MNPSALADDELGESDERGDAGSENDEEQPDNHLIGGFWVVLMESNGGAAELALPVSAKRSPNRTGRLSLHPALQIVSDFICVHWRFISP